MTSDLVPVSVVCPCPGTPHADGDFVYLFPKLGLVGGVIAQRRVLDMQKAGAPQEVIVANLLDVYCRYGTAAWTFTNGHDQALPLSPEAIQERLIDNFATGIAVAEIADGLYSGMVLDPLVTPVSTSSSATSKTESTSPTPTSPRRKRSK